MFVTLQFNVINIVHSFKFVIILPEPFNTQKSEVVFIETQFTLWHNSFLLCFYLLTPQGQCSYLLLLPSLMEVGRSFWGMGRTSIIIGQGYHSPTIIIGRGYHSPAGGQFPTHWPAGWQEKPTPKQEKLCAMPQLS